MHTHRQQQDGKHHEKYEGMDYNRLATGPKVGELHSPTTSRQLKQQPRRQQYEENETHYNRRPIRHLNYR